MAGEMKAQHMKPAAAFLLILNFCMYAIVLGICGWAMNRKFNHYPAFGPGGENNVTIYFIQFSLIAGAVGAGACLFGIHHIYSWGPEGLPSAASAAVVAWSLTMLALGFASKHIRVKTDSERLKTLEAFIIILSGTMLLYIAALHSSTRK